MNKNTLVVLGSTLASTLLTLPVAVAQSDRSNTAGPLEEVIVSAQKRDQNMQDVGVAVTSFSESELKDLRIMRPEDLSSQTPGLDIKNSLGAVNPIFTIRGIGLNDYNTNNNPSVGVYVDEVYMSSGAYLSFNLFDIERVEVLKGPQGTLYGRNTSGGAINFHTAKPTEEFEAYIEADYGNWNTMRVEAAVSGPLGDSVRGRLAMQANQSDGYYKNNGTTVTTGLVGRDAQVLDGLGAALGMPPAGEAHPGNPYQAPDDDFFEQDNFSIRGTLDFDISDTVQARASMHYVKDESDMLVRSMDGDAVDRNGFTPTDNDPYTVDANLPWGSQMDNKGYGGYLKVDIDLSFATLTSITGYESMERLLPFEESSPWRILDTLFSDDMSQFSQELRLTSNGDGDLFWITGLYYGDEEIGFRKDILGLDVITRTSLATEYKQNADNWAAFLHTEYKLSDDLNLIAGIRYSDDHKDYTGGSFVPIAPFGPYGTDLAPIILGAPQYSSDGFDEDDVSGKLGLDWNISDDALLYGSISKGYKSGGYDGSTITNEASFTPFFGETLWAYEAGLKLTLADGTVRWNSAAFFYDFSDIQAEAQRALPNFGGGDPVYESIRTNVGEADIWGIESELWWAPTDELDIKLGIAYLDTEITTWNSDGLDSDDPDVVADALADIEAHVGNEIPDSPQLTFNGLFRYTTSISNSLAGMAQVDFNYVDDTYKNIDNDDYLKAPSYWLVNARIGIASADDTWSAMLWGKNLGDEIYYRERIDNFGPQWVYETPGVPRSYGITVSYAWR
ncbi:MAG: hypothetical protein RI942_16 [Pseudomonadota bacterium]